MKKTQVILGSLIVVVLANILFYKGCLPQPVNAQGSMDAYITSVQHSPKVYEYTQDKWNITVYNKNIDNGIFDQRGWFFLKIYLDNVLSLDESTSTWAVNKGSSVTHRIQLSLGSGPKIVNAKIELYWAKGSNYLEDTKSFTMTIVKVSVNWTPTKTSVEKGKTQGSTLFINLGNNGNDYMYNAKISVTDAAGLQIDPQSQTLQDIAAGGAKSISFSLVAPKTLTTGTKSVSFKIEYSDYRRTLHTETRYAPIVVTPLSTSTTPSLQPSSLKKGETTTITACLKDGNGNPIANTNIDFFVGTTSIGSATTDSSGNAIKSYKVDLDPGTYVIKVSYNGGTEYDSSIGTINVIVKSSTDENADQDNQILSINSTALYIILGIIIVTLIGVIGYVFLRRRRKNNDQKI